MLDGYRAVSDDLPALAGQQIRTWFHGPCLNSRLFAEEICSFAFAQKLAALSKPTDQEHLFAATFVRHVASISEISSRVGIIAEEIGNKLDSHWQSCCLSISEKWNISIQSPRIRLSDNFEAELEPGIRESINQAIQLAAKSGEQRALSTTVTRIGKSAIGLLPISLVQPVFGMPVFVLQALSEAYASVVGHLESSVANSQAVLSDALALLARRVGARFETEVRNEINALQQWQERALRTAAESKAKSSIGLL